MKKYLCISVDVGVKDWYAVQREVEDSLVKRFPSVHCDGGGMMLGSSIRDIFISIDSRSVNKVGPYLEELGYTLV